MGRTVDDLHTQICEVRPPLLGELVAGVAVHVTGADRVFPALQLSLGGVELVEPRRRIHIEQDPFGVDHDVDRFGAVTPQIPFIVAHSGIESIPNDGGFPGAWPARQDRVNATDVGGRASESGGDERGPIDR